MMARFKASMAGLAALTFAGVCTCGSLAQQQGVAERVAEKLDDVGRGIRREASVAGDSVRKAFDTVKGDVGRMGVGSRVYARLHWDRVLNTSKIEVHTLRDGGVLIRGTVPDAAAKTRAGSIAADTVGVTEVVDELIASSTTTPVAAKRSAPGTSTK